ncbi:MAG TPA: hypothetical protein ENK66_03910, partial [Arcobacter sp.]|nr:hypothetical protein [Arcobacter sp.]
MQKILLLFSFFFFSACSVKEYRLFQHENDQHVYDIQDINISISSKIVPNDILEIDIYNMNQKANFMLQNSRSQTPVATQEDNKYTVYSDGTIILPLLNVVKVDGYTVKSLNQLLIKRYKEFLN